MNLEQVLKKLNDLSISKRDKGDKFEKLIKNWFLTTNLYKNNINKIWLWGEFPYRNQLGGNDNGIDIVILTTENEYWAIQCKFYSFDKSIDKKDVDTFISTSEKSFLVDNEKINFSRRMFISTTNKWSSKAENTLENLSIPVNRISFDDLENSDVDWELLLKGKKGNEAKKAKKMLKEHQIKAVNKVHEYFKYNDRGKLIMACGTGKTFTSLKIAEKETNGKGLVLFLVPSIALLGQTLEEWMNDSKYEIDPICVCSDSKITKNTGKQNNDTVLESLIDLVLPATTDVEKVVKQLKKINNEKENLKVVFSTYQSIEVISKAQKILLEKDNNKIFDLIICDEAHRTTGKALPNEEESNFLKVHDNEFIKAKKRLYMTATPRLYDDNSQSKAKEKKIYLCSMDDNLLYGEEIYRIGFGEAVEKGLLTDYKVLILTLTSKDVPKEIMKLLESNENELNLDDASKLIGCINGLSKQILDREGLLEGTDLEPMKKAVAFCSNIRDSKKITENLNVFSKEYVDKLNDNIKDKIVTVSSKHIDGSMNALERKELMNWLKKDEEDEMNCKILTNARCLSEGIDVPSLDAVLFLSPKNSQVDVVQSVGRVMRKFEGKKYGYIIIPIVIPEKKLPEEALNDNKTYQVVWSVLNALRAHDDRFNAEINKIDINKRKPKNILIGKPKFDENQNNSGLEIAEQLELFEPSVTMQDKIFAKMVEKVGDRKYFERWAKDVSKIAELQIDRIRDLLSKNKKYKAEFDNFIKGLQENISPDVNEEQGIEMLSQHIITKPIFEALFENYSFTKKNPVSKAMQRILDILTENQIEKDLRDLEGFYEDVKVRIGGIDNAEGKQKIIVELYDKFFKTAFPKLVEKLGIVYTPIEVVDFIINSVEDILQKEFKRSLTDENVNILDPFTGTGTFITRLLQSRIIKPKDFERKYKYEIYANEIVLLAYYIAAVNIENIYHDMEMKNKNSENIEYKEFEGICLTDTFQLGENDDESKLISLSFKENSERINKLKKSPLQVIIGNPPYSIGQNSANDNAQNTEYPKLKNRVQETYSKLSNAGLNKGLHDAYIKAFRWSTDRLDKNGGIVSFVTNGSWIDGGSTSGFRKSIEKEFSSIYVFNLRGNALGSGEKRKKESGNIFGDGTRTTIAITLLVKNPKSKNEKADIYYYDIGDYLSRDKKLKEIEKLKSINGIEWKKINPNEAGDWVNLRNERFNEFIPLFDKNNKLNKNVFFNISSNGIVTSRDAWVYSFSKNELQKNMEKTIETYNKDIDKIKVKNEDIKNINIEEIIDTTNNNISWSRGLKKSLKKLEKSKFIENDIKLSLYRPFVKEYLYFSKRWIETPSQQGKFKGELAIGTTGIGAKNIFSSIVLKELGDFQTFQNGNFYPLYYYEETKGQLFSESQKKEGITDFIHNLAKEKYGVPKITKEDIFYYVYGFFHNEDYKKEFENDLRKVIPRLPLADNYEDFKKISEIGKKLSELHLNYEKLEKLKEVKVIGEKVNNFKVQKIEFASKENKTEIIFNKDIKICNIPLKAYEYQVNGKSAVEWILERYQVTSDKASGIKNDPNLWCEENNSPRYILDLLLSVITLSVETVKLIRELPQIKF